MWLTLFKQLTYLILITILSVSTLSADDASNRTKTDYSLSSKSKTNETTNQSEKQKDNTSKSNVTGPSVKMIVGGQSTDGVAKQVRTPIED